MNEVIAEFQALTKDVNQSIKGSKAEKRETNEINRVFFSAQQ